MLSLKEKIQKDPNDPAFTKELTDVERELQLAARHDDIAHSVSFQLGQAETNVGDRKLLLETYDALHDAISTAANDEDRERAVRRLKAFEESDPKVLKEAFEVGTKAHQRAKDKKDKAALARGERASQYEYADTFNDAENDFDANANEAQAMINKLPEQQRSALQAKLEVLKSAKKAYRQAHLNDGFDFDALQERPTQISADLWKKFSAEMAALQQNMLDFMEDVRDIFKHRNR